MTKSSRFAATSEVRGHNIANSEVGAGTADNFSLEKIPWSELGEHMVH